MVRITIEVLPEEAERFLAACRGDKTRKQVDGMMDMIEARLRGNAPDRSPTEVSLHIDAADLSGETATGRGVPAGTCRRLLCDAGIVPHLEDTGKTLDVGRKTRTIPGAIRRALARRDRGCRFPGCTARIVDGYHVEHWLRPGNVAGSREWKSPPGNREPRARYLALQVTR